MWNDRFGSAVAGLVYSVPSRTRISSAVNPKTPASATAGSAPWRTRALGQLVEGHLVRATLNR